MNKLVLVLICLLQISGLAFAEPVLDEDTVKAISLELEQAVKDGDLAVFKKYLFPGSKIVIDMDPSNSAGQVEVTYDKYISLLEFALPIMQNADMDVEVIFVSIDAENNQATIKEKTSAVVEMMGTKVRDVSISETTYGIVNGKIKVLSASDELISSEAIS